MSTPQTQYLIDVRSPAEFSTGGLDNAINIEYQIIDQLPDILSLKGLEVKPTDAVTLYCRSGRRSNIAMQTLKKMGFQNVRDIGGLEAAKEVLLREKVMRGMDEEERGEGDDGEIGGESMEKDEGRRKETREKGFGALMEGLKGLE